MIDIADYGTVAVDLTGITANEAYTWGMEAGAFANYDPTTMIGEHVVYAGNIGMIETICACRHMNLDVLSTSPTGQMLLVMIRPKGK